ENDRLRSAPLSPLVGYMRVSKADGSQVLDLQHDALAAAGIAERHLSSDTASGSVDNRPGLGSCRQALRRGAPLVVWKLHRRARRHGKEGHGSRRPMRGTRDQQPDPLSPRLSYWGVAGKRQKLDREEVGSESNTPVPPPC